MCAGLSLGHSKCYIVPVSPPFCSQTVSVFKDFLASHIPEWIDFQITSAAEYLGIWQGPGAGNMHWISQLGGYRQTIADICAAQLPVNIAVKAYNIKAVARLSYPLQFLPPPPDHQRLDKYAFTKIYKLPYNSLSHSQQFNVHNLGMPSLTPIEPLSVAIKARYWHAHGEMLIDVYIELLKSCDNLLLSSMQFLSASQWHWPPVVHTLFTNL